MNIRAVVNLTVSWLLRAAWLNINTDRFNLNCGLSPIGDAGRSRGVRDIASEVSKKVPQSATAEPKLLSAPGSIKSDEYNDKSSLRPIYDPAQLDYVRQVLNGAPSGTVMDWKKRILK